MLTKEFFENQSLYTRYRTRLENDEDKIEYPSIKLFCPKCNSEQTYTHNRSFGNIVHDAKPLSRVAGGIATPIAGEIILTEYLCAGCKDSEAYYLVEFSEKLDYIRKVGQYPEFNIAPDKNIAKMLGKNVYLFSKGRICEVHGYGIGAYAYYRRVVELIIDKLLNKIWSLHGTEEQKKYETQFNKIKKSRIAEEKINIAKDILPSSIVKEGTNPLKTLYDALSEGIHEKNDEECIELADTIRKILVALVNQVEVIIESQEEIGEATKKLLKMKNKK